MNKLHIFTVSLLLSSLLIVFYSIIGYISTFTLKSRYRIFDFDNLFFGVIITVGLYATLKSQFSINSVTITLIPLLVSLRLLSYKQEENNGHRYTTIISGFCLIVFNFLIYFKSKYVNTGYGDHSFYHLITSNITLHGKESVDCAHNVMPFSCGIYHYWDLWHQSLVYEIGMMFKLNIFESYVLVHKTALSLIILIGAIKLGSQYNLDKITIFGIILLITIGIYNEWCVMIHPKQFITFASLILIISKFSHHENIGTPLFIFLLITNLFYSPLSGITLVASVAAYRTIKNIKTIKITIVLCIIIFSSFILLYLFLYHKPIQDLGEIKWEITKSIRHFIFYNIYHSVIINWPLLLILIIGSLIIKDVKLIYGFEFHLTVLILLIGSLFSSLLYFWKEQCQFMFNFQFSMLIFFIKFLSILQKNHPKFSIASTCVISIIAIFQFFNYQKLHFYTPFKIDNKKYFSLRLRAKQKLIPIYDFQETASARQVNEEDFLFSIENKVVKHRPYNP